MCITNRVCKEFGAPLIEILIIGPLYSPYKKMKNDVFEDSNG